MQAEQARQLDHLKHFLLRRAVGEGVTDVLAESGDVEVSRGDVERYAKDFSALLMTLGSSVPLTQGTDEKCV